MGRSFAQSRFMWKRKISSRAIVESKKIPGINLSRAFFRDDKPWISGKNANDMGLHSCILVFLKNLICFYFGGRVSFNLCLWLVIGPYKFSVQTMCAPLKVGTVLKWTNEWYNVSNSAVQHLLIFYHFLDLISNGKMAEYVTAQFSLNWLWMILYYQISLIVFLMLILSCDWFIFQAIIIVVTVAFVQVWLPYLSLLNVFLDL